MKQIVPFTRKIEFNTSVDEITSISLDKKVKEINNGIISGVFDLYLEYKENDISVNVLKYSSSISFDIDIDEKYDLKDVIVDIDDFYYEIVDNKILSINIEVLIDNLEEKPLFVKVEPEKEVTLDDLLRDEEEDSNEEKRCYEDEEFPFKEIDTPIVATMKKEDDDKMDNVKTEDIKSLFDNIDTTNETYSTYKVCILRDNETIEGIMQRYSVTKEVLELYNNLSELKIGDKIIIPSLTNEKI